MDAVEYLDLLLKSLLLAGVYSAMAVGMTVIYGVMKIVNLAHAGFLMLGAYFALEMFQHFHVDPILGSVLALPVFFLFGMAVHWLLVRWLPKSDTPTLASLSADVRLLARPAEYCLSWFGAMKTNRSSRRSRFLLCRSARFPFPR